MSELAVRLNHDQDDPQCVLSSRVKEASVMLDLFECLGTPGIALTITDEAGRKVAFKPAHSFKAMRGELPALFFASSRKRFNVIVRPAHPPPLSFVQLDDLSSSALDRIRPFSFLVLETSSANFQAWLAVPDADPNLPRKIKKAAGGDPSASGATRIAGSYNFKPKYAPNYPVVRLQAVAPMRTVSVSELDCAIPLPLGDDVFLNAPVSHRRFHSLKWPSYARCLADAPLAKNRDGKDRSLADFTFCLISIDRGWSVEVTANRLMAESDKAKSRGYRYALFTAKRAASIVSTNRR